MSQGLQQQWPSVVAAGLSGYMQGQESALQRELTQLQMQNAKSEEQRQQQVFEHAKSQWGTEDKTRYYQMLKEQTELTAATTAQDQKKAADAISPLFAQQIGKIYGLPPELVKEVDSVFKLNMLQQIAPDMANEKRAKEANDRAAKLFPIQVRTAIDNGITAHRQAAAATRADEQAVGIDELIKHDGWAFGLPPGINNAAAAEFFQKNKLLQQQQEGQAAETARSKLLLQQAQDSAKLDTLQKGASIMSTAGENATDVLAKNVNTGVGVPGAFEAAASRKRAESALSDLNMWSNLLAQNPDNPQLRQTVHDTARYWLNLTGKPIGLDDATIDQVSATLARPSQIGQTDAIARTRAMLYDLTKNALGEHTEKMPPWAVAMDSQLNAIQNSGNTEQANVEQAIQAVRAALPTDQAEKALKLTQDQMMGKNFTSAEFGALLKQNVDKVKADATLAASATSMTGGIANYIENITNSTLASLEKALETSNMMNIGAAPGQAMYSTFEKWWASQPDEDKKRLMEIVNKPSSQVSYSWKGGGK